MSVFEAIKKGFVLSAKLLNVVLVFFVFNVVIGLISLPLANPDKAGNPGIAVISIVSSILFFFIFIFLQGGALGLVKDQIKTGTASMSEFNSYGKKYYVKILGLLLLFILIAVGVVLLLSLVSAGLLLLGDNLVTRSIVATIVTVAAVTIITFLIYPIDSVVVDDVGPLEALRRGIGISKANFWRTLGLFVVMLLASLLISLVVGFIVGLTAVPLPADITRIVVAIVNAAVQAYIPIVMMMAFMNFYISIGAESSASK